MTKNTKAETDASRTAQELAKIEGVSVKPTTTGKPRFQTSIVNVKDIPQQQRLGRKSAWGYLISQANSLPDGQVLNFIVQEQNEISSLRASVKKAGLNLTTRTESVTDNPNDKRIRVYIWKGKQEAE